MSAVPIPGDRALIITDETLDSFADYIALGLKHRRPSAEEIRAIVALNQARDRYRAMSQVATFPATSLPIKEWSSQSQKQAKQLISVSEAALIIAVDPRHVYRLIETDPELALTIREEKPLRFDRTAVVAYAADRQRRKVAA